MWGSAILGQPDRCRPRGASPISLARAVADSSLRARLLDVGHKIIKIAAADDVTDARTAVELAQAAMHELAEHGDGDPFTYPELLQPLLDDIESTGKPEPATRGHMSTGIDDLDRLTGGLWPGTLNVIGGRPSIGKTTLALTIARHVAARLNRTTLYFTRETSKNEIARRIAAAEARVPLHILRSGQLSDDDWTKLAHSLSDTSEIPLYIDDRARTIGEIRAKKTRRMHARLGLELIIVDYLQLFANGYHERYRELSDITRDLKDLARELAIPILAISQLNRGPEQRTDHRPQLADLRDSGTVEDDADLVILVYREDHYDRESPRAGEADLIVAKHRHGPTDVVTVAAQLHLSRFVDIVFPSA